MTKDKQDDDRLRNYGKIKIKVYKDMIVTYGEFFEALKQIGYKEMPSETHYKFMPPESKLDLSIPRVKNNGLPCQLNEKMWTPDFFQYSQILYLGYEIDDIDDIAKIIERKRGNEVGRMILG